MDENERDRLEELAGRIALETVVQILALDRFGHDPERLARVRLEAVKGANGAAAKLELDDDLKEHFRVSLARAFESLLTPVPDGEG